MCTLIVTIRTVLWYVMSLAGTLMILVAMFTNRWLDRSTILQAKGDFGGMNIVKFFYDKQVGDESSVVSYML